MKTVRSLYAFINEIRAQRGTKIPAANADELVTAGRVEHHQSDPTLALNQAELIGILVKLTILRQVHPS